MKIIVDANDGSLYGAKLEPSADLPLSASRWTSTCLLQIVELNYSLSLGTASVGRLAIFGADPPSDQNFLTVTHSG